LPDGRSPMSGEHAWHALIELVGDARQAERLQGLAEHLLVEAHEQGLIEDATIAANERQAEDFWRLRDSIAPAERELGPAMQHDISVPVERMAQFIEETVPQVEAHFPGTTAVAFGHLGDGNVHYHVLAPAGAERGKWEASQGKAISTLVHDLVAQWGGSISAEHGIGQLKRDELGRLGDPVSLAMMRAVKRALDPHDLLNPGKLVPLAPVEDRP
jgi:FAD/FMN-containing dehydrogenase